MITDNFIKMCEQAKEIQKVWKSENGDFVYWKVTKSIKIITDHFYTNDWTQLIYLPTQEQLLKGIMNSDCYALRIGNTLYSQNENFGIKIFNQFGHYNIVLGNSPSEFAYNWITWKEDSLNECLLDVYMFRLYYKYWDKGKWIAGLWNREDRRFNPIKEKWVKAE